MNKRFYTIESSDVGEGIILAFGCHWPVEDFIGAIHENDVGKRVYLMGADVLQVENSEQFEARCEAEENEKEERRLSFEGQDSNDLPYTPMFIVGEGQERTPQEWAIINAEEDERERRKARYEH